MVDNATCSINIQINITTNINHIYKQDNIKYDASKQWNKND